MAARVARLEGGGDRRTKLFDHARPEPLAIPVRRQRPGHDFAPGERIARLPRVRPKAEDPELEWQPVPVGSKKAIDPGGIAFEGQALLGRDGAGLGGSDSGEAKAAHKAIEGDRRLAEYLRKSPVGNPTVQLQLPESILSVNVAERVIEVAARRGI